MRSVRLPRELAEAIAREARASYPDECCGFLFATPEGAPHEPFRWIVAVERATNRFDGERRRRFLVRPEEVRSAESRAERAGIALAGFYHSHPDHPARPSRFDQENAWPWYTYVVASVTKTAVGSLHAFELHAERREFAEVPLLLVDARPPASVEGG